MNFLLDVSLLYRNRNFGLLFTGQFISFFGTMITGVALPYQIYHLTHSTLMVGLLSLAQLLPLVATALVGGVLADRHHRRMLLLITESCLMLGCLVLAYNAQLASPHLSVIFITAALMSAVNGLHRPALDSMVQQLVDKKDFATVGSLSTFKYSIAMIGGPALGGLIIAHFGIVVTFLVDFATFLISLMALLLMTYIPKPEGKREDSALASLKVGFKYAMSRQELVGTYVVDFLAMVFGMPMALFPAIAASYGSVTMLGLLYSAPAVGALVVAFFSGWTKHIRRHGMAIAISASLWGVAIFFFGFASNVYVSLFFLILAGAFDGLSGMFRQTMWNQTIPQTLRGRLAGIEMISYMSGPKLGDTVSGFAASILGVSIAVMTGGVMCVIGVGVACFYLPKFMHYRSTVDGEVRS